MCGRVWDFGGERVGGCAGRPCVWRVRCTGMICGMHVHKAYTPLHIMHQCCCNVITPTCADIVPVGVVRCQLLKLGSLYQVYPAWQLDLRV